VKRGKNGIELQRKECVSAKSSTSLCCATFQGMPLASVQERPAQYRGAATEVVGEILNVANLMVAAGRYIPGKRSGLADGRSPEEAMTTSRSEWV
jgi:hypothetical protein